MKFHPEKCFVLPMSRKANTIAPTYHLHGQTLQTVTAAKYLGCTITADLRWTTHCNNICTKANQTLGFLKRNLNISSVKIKEQAYKSLVRPLVEYACTVWDPYHQEDIHRLEMVQRRGARYVTGQYGRTTSVTGLIDNLRWQTLQDRRKDARLTMLFKVAHNKVAVSKKNRLLPPHRTSRGTHELCFQTPFCRQDYRHNSFFPRTIREWNQLPVDIAAAPSIEAFKASLGCLHSWERLNSR